MGIAPDVGMGAIRFSLGRATTGDEIDAALERLTDVLAVTG
jgi:cysteine desulfurase